MFGSIAIANPTSRTADVTLSFEGGPGNHVSQLTVAPHGWLLTGEQISWGSTVVITSSEEVVVSADLRGRPNGVRVVAPSGGRQ